MAVQQSEVISKNAGLEMLRAKRDQDGTRAGNEPPVNAVQEAARALGQRSAEVRRGLLNNTAPQAPAQDKPANPQRTAPGTEKPEDQAEDNAEELAPEGQDALEEQPEEGEAETDESDGSEPTITIDGQKLSAQEIRDSYLRRDDYSRKTAEVAEQRKVLDGAVNGVAQISQKATQLVGILEQAVGQEPDWAALAYQMDPRQFNAARVQWDQQQKVIQTVKAENERNFTQALAQAKAAMVQEAARTFKPEWQDPVKQQEGVGKLADYAVAEGILPQELAQLYRTPMLKILDKAFKWDESQKAVKVMDKRVQGKPKPTRPGNQPNRLSAAENQLQSARQVWESIKNPTIRQSNDWIQAKRSFESSTGRKV